MSVKNYFHKWSGIASEHKHEKKQISHVSKILSDWANETKTITHLLSNFTYNSEEIDLAIILPSSFILIDLKTGGGIIEGTENGFWTSTALLKKTDKNQNAKPIKINRNRNPFIQADKKKWAFLTFLNDYNKRIFSDEKSKKVEKSFIYALKSHIVFSNEVSWDRSQIPSGTMRTDKWFDVYSIKDLVEKIVLIEKEKNIQLLEEEQWSICTLLNLIYDDNKHDFSEIESKYSNLPKETVSSYKLKGELIHTQFVDIVDENTIYVEDKDGKRLKVHLNDYFKNTVSELRKLSNSEKQINKNEIDINLVNVERKKNDVFFKNDKESFLVIEPEWLINVTELAQLDFCERQLFNSRYTLKSRNEAMTRGSIIHEVFEDILQRPEDIDGMKEKLGKSFSDRSLEFALDNLDYKGMEDYIKPHLNKLYQYRTKNPLISHIKDKDVSTERFIINPVLGLKGKIDAVVTDVDGSRAIELKTGKKRWEWVDGRPTQKITPGHRSQVQAYSLLMEMKSELKISNPIIVYSGEETDASQIGETIEFSYLDKTKSMNKRNKLVLADYLMELDYEKDNPNKCLKCKDLDVCQNIFSLEKNHNPNNLPKYFTQEDKFQFNDNIFTRKEKQFFNQYNQLLTEEYRINKEAQGTFLLKDKIERLTLGKTAVIDAFQEVEINKYILNSNNDSELREGDRCLISDKNGPIYGDCLEATILSVSRSNFIISTRAKMEFIPVFLDIYPQENIFARNYPMIYELIANKENEKIKNFIINKSNPASNTMVDLDQLGTLHESQMKAIKYALGLKDYLLIQGPPGTGKTLTIAHIIDQLALSGKKVIIGCYTHRAVDEVIKKLKTHSKLEFPVYRLGESTSEEINEFSIEKIVNDNKTIDSKVQKANSIFSDSAVYIATTHKWLSGGFDTLIKKYGKYDVAIIDEASQVIIPNAIGTIRLAKKFILVGDHKQLPPVIQSEQAKDLSNTLFEELYNNDSACESTKVMLDIQHRMPEQISNFISNEFYNNQLNTFKSDSNSVIELKNTNSDYASILQSKKAIELLDVKSSNNDKNQSNQEAVKIKEILKTLLASGIDHSRIGVIAPFRAQVAEIRRNIELELMEYFDDVVSIKNIVDTVDRFQGDERDVILFSLTIGESEIPKLLQDKRRLNVAISRAKMKFIAIGDWDKALQSETLSNLKKYYDSLGDK